MDKNKIKNVLLILLIIIAVHQTLQLWFESFSDRNFFYSIFAKNINLSPSNSETPFYAPYRIISSDGNKNILIFYSEIKDIMEEQHFEDLAKEIDNLEFVSEETLNLNEILNTKTILYQYNFLMDMSFFLESLNEKNNNLISKVGTFNTMAIIPPRNNQINTTKIIFINEKENKAYNYNLTKTKLNYNLYEWFTNRKTRTNELAYEYPSSGLQIMSDNLFLPRINEKFYYKMVNLYNPYKDIGSYDLVEQMDKVQPLINGFFDNPLATVSSEVLINPSNINNENINEKFYIYSDTTQKVLLYYPFSHYLEYNNFKTEKYLKDSFVSAYNRATSFINNDDVLLNEYYLYDYKFEDYGVTFYFDYVIDNFPIIVNKNIRDKTDMKHQIEITVENGVVTHYKKIIFNYTSILGPIDKNDFETTDFAEIPYNQVLDLMSENVEEDNFIKNITLGFTAEIPSDSFDGHNNIGLSWFFFDKYGIDLSYATKLLEDQKVGY